WKWLVAGDNPTIIVERAAKEWPGDGSTGSRRSGCEQNHGAERVIKAPQELWGGQPPHSLLIALGIILPAECNLRAIEGREAVVGDGDAMSVAGEIGEDMMGTAEGWFGIDDPVLTEQGAQESAEGFLVLERSKRAGEDQLALLESSLESGGELTAKDAAEHAHRQEEGIARVD